MSQLSAIQVKEINKLYGRKPVLHGVSFAVQAGTIHGFVGPNGAGKSTTLGIVTRLVLPSTGDIFIWGKSVSSDPSFNEHLGFVPAESHFPDGWTVKECVLKCARLRDVSEKEVLARLAQSDLSRHLNQTCNSLSTGQMKMLQLFLIFALIFEVIKKRGLNKKIVLLLDEPFNGLDFDNRDLLTNRLHEIKASGAAVFISTHDLDDLQHLADYITMIKQGQIVYDGPKTADIKDTYRKIFRPAESRNF
ncbi:MAG: ABC transporter ATP-binding protein [Candidatus Moeniiplasma glomeromycotorum]|nr:ABC transporter ATP-binding protein [Candidatus Moeniiplasma glomeromycotorum]MCE8167420.1 ABC transporter ATP-binding protein [Candidatus Moeniiplasma glomeromycotorum]MCE8168566.1 ABC transporter ATP-binding protein [Candidatus Moeniiplasma glomeromycotorum]